MTKPSYKPIYGGRRLGGREPVVRTEAAQLLVKVFGSYANAGVALGVSRQAVQVMASKGVIHREHLMTIRRKHAPGVQHANVTSIFNKLGEPHKLQIES